MTRLSLDKSGRRKSALAVSVSAALTLTLGACGDKSDSGAAASAQLTMIVTSAPASLDPGLMNVDPNNLPFAQLGYEPLIRVDKDGKYGPGLATSFGYVGTGNTKFAMQIRSGVKFADGTPVTGVAVAASITYAVKAGGPGASWLGGCQSFTATAELEVTVSCTSPNPTLERLFSQNAPFGFVISPAGLANAAGLKSGTYGAGQYVLDTAKTVANDHYVYTPNKQYWDQKAIHYKQVTLKVVTSPNAALSSIQAGQADVAVGDPQTADAASSAGLTVLHAPSYTAGVNLFDRAGVVAKPLADPRVRQALNYGIDRKAINTALFGAFGTPTTQIQTPTYDGYDKSLDDMYPYDPAKAKALLTEAGYPNGFSMTIEAWQGFNVARVTEAIMGYWTKIGVSTDLTKDVDAGVWINGVLSKKFPAAGYAYAGLPVFQVAKNWFEPSANPYNPFLSTDPHLTDLLLRAAAAPPAEAGPLNLEVMRYGLQQGWWVTASLIDLSYYTRKSVEGVNVTTQRVFTDVTQIQPGS